MVIKTIFFLFLLAGCGRDVKFSKNNLEKMSSITTADSEKLFVSGVLKRESNGDFIYLQDKAYKVNTGSSYLALEFIAARPAGSVLSVSFKGIKKPPEIVLEEINEQK